MTATDPRPRLAAALAARLAPAAESLAAAYEDNIAAGPPPQEDRALAEHHRAGRAALAHLRQLLAPARLGRRPPARTAARAPAAKPRTTPTRRPRRSPAMTAARTSSTIAARPMPAARTRRSSGPGWPNRQRRFGPLVADEDDYDGSEDEYNFGERRYVGKLTTPEFASWLERQERREAAARAAREPPG